MLKEYERGEIMKKIEITIEETYVQSFDIMANSEEEAMELAEKMYKKGELVLEKGEVQHRQMAVTGGSMPSEWWEF